MSTKLERKYENLVHDQIILTPSNTAEFLEVVCYVGSCTITSGWILDDNFVDDDFDPITITASGKKTGTANMPRPVVKITNPSADCKIILFSYR